MNLRHTLAAAGTAAFLAAGLAPAANAQAVLSEIYFNPSGTDGGQEAIELSGTPSLDLTGWKILAIEGDGTAAGVVDQVLALDGSSLGTNGLLLWRDGATVLLPAPDAATTLKVADFSPDIENGTNTYVLGFGTAPAVTTDLDTDGSGGDGTLDITLASFGFTVVDAVTVIENDGVNNFGYADDLGFSAGLLPQFGFTPQAVYRIYDGAGAPVDWAGGTIPSTAVSPGPYTWNFLAGGVFGCLAPTVGPQSLDLGSANGSVSLGADRSSVSIATGGTQNFTLCAGAANGGDLAYMAGSTSGTVPGIPLGVATLPLNLDSYTLFTLSPNPVMYFFGALSPAGKAATDFVLPPGTTLSPFTAHHAYAVIDLATFAVSFASNATPVDLVP